VIDYHTEDFTKDETRYDFVIDAVGKSSFGACRAILKPRGFYVSAELGPRNENLYLPLVTPLRAGPKVRFPFPANVPGSLAQVRSLIEQGKLRPVIDRTYPLEAARDAFEYVASGQKIGSVILRLG
jgi:NADPH:quinone reductase-like Zn-dependent oxidoreductase